MIGYLATAAAGVPTPTPSGASAAQVFGAGLIGFSLLLSVIVWTPVVWAGIMAALPNPRGRNDHFFLLSAFWVNAGCFALSVIGYMQFSLYQSTPQFEETLAWIPAYGITYHLGADGVSMVMLLLSGLVGIASVLASTHVRERRREYFVLLLVLQGAVNGAVVARDLFVLVLFFGAATVPVALLVHGWGGPNRVPAAFRLAAYWALGTAALLAAALLIYGGTGARTFDLDFIAKASATPRLEVVAGILVVVAAATRLPLFPLHGWARAALAEATPGVAVVIAGAASRLGAYVLVRVLDLALPAGARPLAPLVAILAGATIVYAALATFRARDLRTAGAYLAVVPGAIAALGAFGITPLSINGAVISTFAGGLAAALMVGACATFAARAQTADLGLLSGAGLRMPRLALLLVLAGLGILCVPLSATFVGGLMVFLGSAKVSQLGTLTALAGLALAAAAVGWVAHRVLLGAPNPDAPAASDSSLSESWYLGLLAGALLWFGIVPNGPRIASVPLPFDPGVVNVVNAALGDATSIYAPPAPPAGP